jgi:hypothetical protein
VWRTPARKPASGRHEAVFAYTLVLSKLIICPIVTWTSCGHGQPPRKKRHAGKRSGKQLGYSGIDDD